MPFTIVKKDITTVERGVILHGVNCQNVMGSGVAKAIKTKWPKVYDAFISTQKKDRILGHTNIIKLDENLWVFNCFTQVYYGRDGERYASLEGISEAVEKGFIFAKINKLPIFMPKIGCGLGGVDWESEVEPIIENLRNKHQVLVTIYEK